MGGRIDYKKACMTYQNLLNEAKAVLVGKFIVVNTYVKREDFKLIT